MEDRYSSKIEDYLRGDLSGSSLTDFEREISENSELKNLLDEYELCMETIDGIESDKLKAKFALWKQEGKNTSRKLFPFFSAIAAGILVLIGIYYIYNHKFRLDTSEEIALKYYALPQTPEHAMGDDNELWQKGIKAYNKQMFNEALSRWIAIEQPDAEVKYYMAHCFFNLEEYDKAILIFKKLSTETSVFSYSAEWYLILSFLTSDNIDGYKKQINIVLENRNHPYYKDVLELKKIVERKLPDY